MIEPVIDPVTYEVIELIIPYDLIEQRILHQLEEPKYGTRRWPSVHDTWICFRPDIERWIDENIKRKSRKKIVVFEHRQVSSKIGFKDTITHRVHFPTERDATLFKLWWM